MCDLMKSEVKACVDEAIQVLMVESHLNSVVRTSSLEFKHVEIPELRLLYQKNSEGSE